MPKYLYKSNRQFGIQPHKVVKSAATITRYDKSTGKKRKYYIDRLGYIYFIYDETIAHL